MNLRNKDLRDPRRIYVVMDAYEDDVVAYFSRKPDAELFVAAMEIPSSWEVAEVCLDEFAHELRKGNRPWAVSVKLDGSVYGQPYVSSYVMSGVRFMPTAFPPRLDGTFWAKDGDEAVARARPIMEKMRDESEV